MRLDAVGFVTQPPPLVHMLAVVVSHALVTWALPCVATTRLHPQTRNVRRDGVARVPFMVLEPKVDRELPK